MNIPCWLYAFMCSIVIIFTLPQTQYAAELADRPNLEIGIKMSDSAVLKVEAYPLVLEPRAVPYLNYCWSSAAGEVIARQSPWVSASGYEIMACDVDVRAMYTISAGSPEPFSIVWLQRFVVPEGIAVSKYIEPQIELPNGFKVGPAEGIVSEGWTTVDDNAMVGGRAIRVPVCISDLLGFRGRDTDLIPVVPSVISMSMSVRDDSIEVAWLDISGEIGSSTASLSILFAQPGQDDGERGRDYMYSCPRVRHGVVPGAWKLIPSPISAVGLVVVKPGSSAASGTVAQIGYPLRVDHEESARVAYIIDRVANRTVLVDGLDGIAASSLPPGIVTREQAYGPKASRDVFELMNSGTSATVAAPKR